jgi:hypothetical protein
VKKNEMGGACAVCRGEARPMEGSWRKPEGKNHYENQVVDWEDNIKMDLKSVVRHGLLNACVGNL